MASVLDDSLVDDLLPTVDDLRGDLLPQFGIRQFVVKIVTETWSGATRGEGDATRSEVVISPPPRVEFPPPPGGLRFDLKPQGREEEGLCKVSEISLAAYQHDDLTGGQRLPRNVSFFWALEDAHGQGIPRRTYTLAAPPVADREKTLGWIVWLRKTEDEEVA